MHNNTQIPDTRLIIGLITLAIAGCLIPHPDNFTPIAAIALFAGALLPGWRAWCTVPLALVASNMLLGYAPGLFDLVIGAGFLMAVALGRWLSAQRTWSKIGLVALGSSTAFFIITYFIGLSVSCG